MDTNNNEKVMKDMIAESLRHPGGLVEEVRDYILETAVCPQEKFALAAALSFVGTLYGRKVETEDGQRTNLFCMNVGYTSSGKDHPLKMVAKMLDKCDATHLRLGQVTSDSAIEWALKRQPRFCFLIDEAGHYFGNISDAKAKGSCQSTIKPALLELWSTAAGRYVGKQRVPRDGKEVPPIVIDNPHLCMLAATQPQTIFEAMSRTDLRDGWLSRNLFFISKERPMPREPKVVQQMPFGIVKAISDWKEELPTPVVYTVKYTEEARAEFNELATEVYGHMLVADKTGNEQNYLLGKAVENAKRIALTIAAPRFSKEAIIAGEAYISGEDATYACQLVRSLAVDMLDVVKESMFDSVDEKHKKSIMKLIAQSGKNGMTLTEISRKTQYLRASSRNEYLDDLMTAGFIVEQHLMQSGGGSKYYAQDCLPKANLSPKMG